MNENIQLLILNYSEYVKAYKNQLKIEFELNLQLKKYPTLK